MARLSESPRLRLVAYLFAIGSFAYGSIAIFKPSMSLEFFGFQYPAKSDSSRTIIDALMLIYGIRDIYMGVAMLAAAYYKHSKMIGLLTLLNGAIAGIDGVICFNLAGAGHWNHWNLLPLVFGVAACFLGAFD